MTKRNVLVTGLLGVALVLLAGAQTWVRGTVADAVLADSKVAVSGSTAAPALVASALVAAAGLLAATTTGRIARVVSGLLATLAGAATLAATAVVLAGPAEPVRGKAAALTGRTGDVAVQAALTPWPWVAILGGVLTTLAGLAALAGARRWAGLSSTYEAPARSRERVVSDWDRLSLGEDPTRDNPPGGAPRST